MGARKVIKIKGATLELNLEETFELFDKFLYKFANEYYNCGNSIDDLHQIAAIGLIKAFNKYDAANNVLFISYLGICIRNEILMNYRKNFKIKNEMSYDNIITGDEFHQNTYLSLLIDTTDYEEIIIKKFSVERIKRDSLKLKAQETIIYKLFYEEELTQSQVATAMGLSQSYVSRKIKEINHILKRFIVLLTILDKRVKAA
jgi:RNA polymerase sigma factor (sigma-70 family)